MVLFEYILKIDVYKQSLKSVLNQLMKSKENK